MVMAPDILTETVGETQTPFVGVTEPGESMIVATPGTCGGEPRIAGTRIKVRHVVQWVERQGMSVAEVVESFPHLNRSQVHTALAYYWSHRDMIDADIRREDELISELKANASPSCRLRSE